MFKIFATIPLSQSFLGLFDTGVINIQQPKPVGLICHSDLQNWRPANEAWSIGNFEDG